MNKDYQTRLGKLSDEVVFSLGQYVARIKDLISDFDGVNSEIRLEPRSNRPELDRLLSEMFEVAGVQGYEVIGIDGDSDVFIMFDNKDDRVFILNLLKGNV